MQTLSTSLANSINDLVAIPTRFSIHPLPRTLRFLSAYELRYIQPLSQESCFCRFLLVLLKGGRKEGEHRAEERKDGDDQGNSVPGEGPALGVRGAGGDAGGLVFFFFFFFFFFFCVATVETFAVGTEVHRSCSAAGTVCLH
jgi:hypothetical protein